MSTSSRCHGMMKNCLLLAQMHVKIYSETCLPNRFTINSATCIEAKCKTNHCVCASTRDVYVFWVFSVRHRFWNWVQTVSVYISLWLRKKISGLVSLVKRQRCESHSQDCLMRPPAKANHDFDPLLDSNDWINWIEVSLRSTTKSVRMQL